MRNKTASAFEVEVMVSTAEFFLLPVASLQIPLFFFSPSSEVTDKLGAHVVKHSLGFVHDTEGERKASSNLLKLSLRNEAVLIVIVVLEH